MSQSINIHPEGSIEIYSVFPSNSMSVGIRFPNLDVTIFDLTGPQLIAILDVFPQSKDFTCARINERRSLTSKDEAIREIQTVWNEKESRRLKSLEARLNKRAEDQEDGSTVS